MKVLKYVVLFALPILLFVNLWRLGLLGDNNYYFGFKYTIKYVSTYRGWQATIDFFNNMYGIVAQPNSFTDVLALLTSPLWAPLYLLGALISDLLYHLGFFFGWISDGIFNYDLHEAKDPHIIEHIWDVPDVIPLN